MSLSSLSDQTWSNADIIFIMQYSDVFIKEDEMYSYVEKTSEDSMSFMIMLLMCFLT